MTSRQSPHLPKPAAEVDPPESSDEASNGLPYQVG